MPEINFADTIDELRNRIAALEAYIGTVDPAASGFDHGGLTGLDPGDDHPQYLRKDGGTMTGNLILSADPVALLEPATKQYADRPMRNLIQNGPMESWAKGTAVAPDNWTLIGAGAAAAREATIVKMGSYSARLKAGAGANAYLRQLVPWHVYWRGRELTLGAWGWADDVNRCGVAIWDGVGTSYSTAHTGGSTWEWLTVTRTIDAAATTLLIALYDYNGTADYVYFDGATLVERSGVTLATPHVGDLALLVGSYKNDTTVSEHRNLVLQYGITASSSGNKAVTFGTAYSVVFGAWPVGTGANWYYTASLTTTGCTFTRGGGASSDSVLWWALGIL